MEINQKHLEAAISELEKGYVTSTIELIKIPVYEELINKELTKKGLGKERIKNLKATLETNSKQSEGHKESLWSVGKMLTEIYKLRK